MNYLHLNIYSQVVKLFTDTSLHLLKKYVNVLLRWVWPVKLAMLIKFKVNFIILA